MDFFPVKQLSLSAILARITSALTIVGLLGVVAGLMTAPVAKATAGINPQMNFQGRLLTNTGAIVADGNYNIEFKLYTGGNGCVGGGSSPCSGTNVWTEDWYNNASNGVVVKNGYFSVSLGSISTLSGVDFNNDTLWLSMNIGGVTTGVPTLDGEMLPFKRLSSSPYAFNAGLLGGLSSSAFAQLSAANTFTAANLFSPGASAVVGLTVKASTAGTANGLEVFDSSNVRQAYFDASGKLNVAQTIQPTTNGGPNLGTTSLAFGNLYTAAVDSGSTTTTLSLGTSTATVVNLGRTAATLTEEGSTIQVGNGATAHTISIGTGAAVQGVSIGSTTTTSATTIEGGATAATGIAIGNGNTNHVIKVGTGTGVEAITIGSTSSTSGTTIQSGSAGITLTGNTTLAGTFNNGIFNKSYLQSNDSTAHAYKIATLPLSTSGTYDHLHMIVTLNNAWGATGNSYIDISLANRNSFAYTWSLRGPTPSPNATLQIYNNSGAMDVYLVFTGGTLYTDATYTVLEAINETVYATPTDAGASPTGTLAFDASAPTTYPPTSAVAIDDSTNSLNATTTLNLATGASNKTINLGAVGSTANTTTVNLANSTGAVQAVNIGSTNGTSTTTIQGGVNSTTATISLQTATNGYIAIGTSNASFVQIGSVGSITTNTNVNIADTSNGTGTQIVSIGSSANAANSLTLEAGNTGKIQIGNAATAHTINIGTGAAVQGVSIGSTNSTSATTIESGSGLLAIGNGNTAHTIAIGTGSAVQGVTIGSTNSTSSTAINAGTGNITLTAPTVKVGSNGTATGQLYVGGSVPTSALSTTSFTAAWRPVVVGRYAYAISENNPSMLQVYDVSNPASPTALGSVSLGGYYADDIAVAGHYAYVTLTTSAKLVIVDISNPNSPSVAGSLSLTTAGGAVSVAGRYAYVLDANTLRVIDISKPSAPVSVSVTGTIVTSMESITVEGRYAYVGSSNGTGNNFFVYDISNPTSTPTSVGSLTTSHSIQDIAIQGRYAYTANYTSHTLDVIDVGNPASPSLAGSVSTTSSANVVTAAGRYVYVGTNGALQAYDVTTPSTPTLVGSVTLANGVTGVSVAGRYVYTGSYNGSTFQTFDFGGTYTQQLEAGAAELANLSVTGDSSLVGNASIQGGLQIGQSLQVAGDAGITGNLNVAGNYYANGAAGQTVTACTGGQVLTNIGVTNGIVTSLGTCAANGGGVAPTLQDAYNNSLTSPAVIAETSGKGIQIQDFSTTTGNILSVTSASGTTAYLNVTSSGINANSLDVVSGSTLALGATAVTLSVGAGTSSNTISIGNNGSGVHTVNVGSSNSTSSTNIESGSAGTLTIGNGNSNHGISIGTGTGVQGITIGSTNSTSGLTLESGSSTLAIGNGATAHNIQIGTGAAVQGISIGSTNTTSSVTIEGGATAGTAIAIGNGATAHVIKIGTGVAVQGITIGSTTSTSGLTLESGSNGLNIGNGATAHTINIGTGAAVQGVSIGSSNSTSSTTIESGSGTLAIGNGATAHTIAIGTGAAVQGVTIGSTTSSSATTINAGSGGIAVNGNTTITGTTTHNGAITATGGGITQTLNNTYYSPSIIGSISTGTGSLNGNHAIATGGKFLYVVSKFAHTFTTIDTSNPASPTIVGTLTDATHLNDVKSLVINGHYAYLASYGNSALEVVDISNPYAPTWVSELADGTNLNGFKGIAASGRYVYAAVEASGKLVVIDVANPAVPVELGIDTTTLAGAKGIYVVGRYAYVATGNGGSKSLTIVDVSNPNSPSTVGSVVDATKLSLAQWVYVSGHYAYVANASAAGYLVIIDVSNPASPSIVGSLTNADTSNLQTIQVVGNYAYGIASGSTKFLTFNVSNPASPSEVSSGVLDATRFSQGQEVGIIGHYAYVTNDLTGAGYLTSLDLAGSDLVTANIGGLAANTLQVTEDASVMNTLSVGGSLQVGQNINATGSLSVLGNIVTQGIYGVGTATGQTLTACTGGQVLTNIGVTGGIITSLGTCATNGGGVSPTLQNVYDNSSSPATILLTNAKNFVINAPDTATDPSIVFNLQCSTCSSNGGRFAVQDAGTDVFEVNPNGDIVIGTASNNVTFVASNNYQSTASGSARQTKVIRLAPEFPNSVLDTGATGNNTGTMTSGLDLSNRMNYYKWTTTSGSNQSYDVVVQVPIPSDFGAWVASNPLSITAYTSNTSNGTITAEVRNSSGTADSHFASFQSATPGSPTTWATTSYSLDSSGYTAGNYLTIRIRLQAPASGDTRVGNITLSYLAKF